MGWGQVIAAAVAAGGVISVPEAIRLAEVSPSSVHKRVRCEGWTRPFRGVLAVPELQPDGLLLARAAALSYGGDPRPVVAATRDTALALYGVGRSFPTRPQFTVAEERNLRPRAGTELFRTRCWADSSVSTVHGVPVLRAAALVRQLAAVRRRESLRDAVLCLTGARHLDLDDLRSEIVQHRHFIGRTALREVLAELDAGGRTDSPLEHVVRTNLEGDGIPLDRGQVLIPGTRMHVDLGIAVIRFGIEVDSFAWHSSPAALERDARRKNAIATVAPDWVVLHVTWQTVSRDWPSFVARVRRVVRDQSRRHLSQDWPVAAGPRRTA
ncbi:MAG: hypothetical protein JJT89_16005 [Nitriliruptoraceae bacterium]|nr:hypothetical protein [Nitriliruptoraceae bacterium]